MLNRRREVGENTMYCTLVLLDCTNNPIRAVLQIGVSETLVSARVQPGGLHRLLRHKICATASAITFCAPHAREICKFTLTATSPLRVLAIKKPAYCRHSCKPYEARFRSTGLEEWHERLYMELRRQHEAQQALVRKERSKR
jgi:hypothetical protein